MALPVADNPVRSASLNTVAHKGHIVVDIGVIQLAARSWQNADAVCEPGVGLNGDGNGADVGNGVHHSGVVVFGQLNEAGHSNGRRGSGLVELARAVTRRVRVERLLGLAASRGEVIVTKLLLRVRCWWEESDGRGTCKNLERNRRCMG